ncbi:hypothetical protein [Mycolicibacterium fortuitum]|uniref:hypothetical protein n=1 Tax=Mycolicibacterium fortuitum TaxID=1766 RepID=UPI0026067320|nr:hypothetical protein [Mycolicibacterium fortuitum]
MNETDDGQPIGESPALPTTEATPDPLARLDFAPTFGCECNFRLCDHTAPCTNQATYRINIHRIDRCTDPDLVAGGTVHLVCPDCLLRVHAASAELAERIRTIAKMFNIRRACRGCWRDLDDVAHHLESEPLQ